MAQGNVAEDLENELTCQICSELLKEPKTLPCLHSYCIGCIGKWFDTCKRERRPCTCPVCKAEIQQTDPSKLPSAFYLNALRPVLDTIRSSSQKPVQLAECCGNTVPLTFFCRQEVCKKCICHKCFLSGHRDHDVVDLEKAAEEAKQDTKADLKRMKELMDINKEALEQSKRNMRRLEQECDRAKEKAHKTTETAIKLLRDHEESTVNALDETLLGLQQVNHNEQIDILDAIKRENECVQQQEGLVNRDIACEVLKSDKVIKQRCQALFAEASLLATKPVQRDVTVDYVTNTQVMQSLSKIGRIIVTESKTDPSRSTIESLTQGRCGFVNDFYIITRNSKGEVNNTRIASIDIKIKDVTEEKCQTRSVRKRRARTT